MRSLGPLPYGPGPKTLSQLPAEVSEFTRAAAERLRGECFALGSPEYFLVIESEDFACLLFVDAWNRYADKMSGQVKLLDVYLYKDVYTQTYICTCM